MYLAKIDNLKSCWCVNGTNNQFGLLCYVFSFPQITNFTQLKNFFELTLFSNREINKAKTLVDELDMQCKFYLSIEISCWYSGWVSVNIEWFKFISAIFGVFRDRELNNKSGVLEIRLRNQIKLLDALSTRHMELVKWSLLLHNMSFDLVLSHPRKVVGLISLTYFDLLNVLYLITNQGHPPKIFCELVARQIIQIFVCFASALLSLTHELYLTFN